MADNDLIDLLNSPEKDGADPGESTTHEDGNAAFDPALIASWHPGERDYPNVLFITFAGFALICVVINVLRSRPGGMPLAATIVYTLLIPWILSDRFLRFVPWALLNRFRKKFLLMHCLALFVVYAITNLAFAARTSLPDWFVTSGKRPALFYYVLGGVVLGLAFWESSWISGHKVTTGDEAEQK
jgi:hypothetical protein